MTPEQERLLNENLKKQFAQPQLPKMPAPMGPSSFDVDAMGPNLATTLKTPPTAPPPPVSDPNMQPQAAQPPAPSSITPPPPPGGGVPTQVPSSTPAEKVVSSHPGFNDDELAKVIAAQKSRLSEFGADQEKAVMDEIRNRHGGFMNMVGDKMAQVSDSIMQGVARAGSGQAAARREQAEQNEVTNALNTQKQLHETNLKDIAAEQQLDQLDSTSPMGRAMISTWGPLMDKIGIPKEKQASMLPALLQTMIPEEVKLKEAETRAEANRLNAKQFAETKADQRMFYAKGRIVDNFAKNSSVVKAKQSKDGAEFMNTLLDAKNPIAEAAIPTFMARASGEVGALSEADKAPFGGSRAILSRLQAIATQAATGRMTEENRQYIQQLTGAMNQAANRIIAREARSRAGQYAQAYEISPESVYSMLMAEYSPEGPISAPAQDVPVIDSQEAYDALPKGAQYKTADGRTGTKK